MKRTLALLLMLAAAPGSAAPERADQVDQSIKRLAPSAFPQLPKPVARYLASRQCTVPQSAYRPEERHNVVRGEFMVAGRKDWAVLCSRRGTSVILVFRPGRPTPVAELDPVDDRHFVQGGVGGVPEFSRSISRATPSDILYYRKALGGPLPRRLDHDGIDASFDGKASVIRYFEQGRWLELTGMD